MKNKEATRYFSDKQEKEVAKMLDGNQTPNSGATGFVKGDVILDNLMLIECKTKTKESNSFSINKNWIEKNELERKEMQLPYSCLAIKFNPDDNYSGNYFVINSKLMKMLVEHLKEED